MLVCTLLFMLCFYKVTGQQNLRHPDIDLNISQLLNKYGYPLETHEIETEDGYLLTTFRIPHGRNSTKIGIPILMVPGTAGCAENFLLLGPDESVGYFLADKGFDVWLMNQRGTIHSRKHKFLDPNKDPLYWKFDFHEVGVYDTPANVDYILNATKRSKLFYIGHSQGTTTYFIFTSERPEYNEKIIVGVQFGVTVFVGQNLNKVFTILGKYHRIIEYVVETLNIHYVFPNDEDLLKSLKYLCSASKSLMYLCAVFFCSIDPDESLDNFNVTTIPLILRNSPAGSSVYQMLHYFQFFESSQFRQYDYGPEKNLMKYNSTIPPLYDIRKCTAPVAIFLPKNDYINSEYGLKRICTELPNLIGFHEIPGFHHADFLWADNVTNLVNKPLYRLLKKYSKA